jgi:hypothetical protein
MPLLMTATEVVEVKPGVWGFVMPPHQVRNFGATNHSVGDTSVLLLRRWDYDASKHHLQFDATDVVPINVGRTPQVIALAANEKDSAGDTATAEGSPELMALGPGDREFLHLARSELSSATARAAEQLLIGIRRKSPGNLKRGQARNFSETPDNFWYVIVQPRVDELSITIRGPVEHFERTTKLEVRDDRGNTRFKVRSETDVPAALDLISRALRKRH